MNLPADILERLLALRHPEGGWAYAPKQLPQVEPTCFALLALAGASEQRLCEETGAVLAHWQDADGAFRVRNGRAEAVWPTALAAFTLSAIQGTDRAPSAAFGAAIGRAAGWLLHHAGRQVPEDDPTREDIDLDTNIIGWPWADGNFSWVEPTAWACLAISHGGWPNHPRVRQGYQLLIDRAFDEGGINYGNRRVFGRMTEPVPSVTALMLLAFAGRQPPLPPLAKGGSNSTIAPPLQGGAGGGSDHPRLQAARRYLAEAAQSNEDLENLCWMRLALGHWPEDEASMRILPMLREKITAAYAARHAKGLFADAPMREALAVLALAVESSQPFRPSAHNSIEKSIPVAVANEEERHSWTQRLSKTFRRWGVKALGHLRGVPPETAVHIAAAENYDEDLTAILQRQYESFRGQVPLAGKRVVLKPNLVEYHPDKVINTNPRVIAAMIEMCKSEGAAEVVVAEGPGHWRNTEFLVEASGLGAVLKHHGVHFVDLNHDDPVKLPNLGQLTGLEYLYFARTIGEAEVLISMPKMKTHHWAGVTLSCKNLFGTLPGICYGWPKNELHWRGIPNSIIDIALTRTPDLSLVDGVIGMEGDGPLNGTPKPLGVLVMGTDPLAVDSTCCRLMHIDPQQVPHLALGQSHRLGLLAEPRIRQVGEAIEAWSSPFELLDRHAFMRLKAERKQEMMASRN